ncbi:MAG: hypothetical protein JWN04_5557 [Myxococcaceae bacterium]|nr:hypothetical protein [Myxococcaceae bacterium]
MNIAIACVCAVSMLFSACGGSDPKQSSSPSEANDGETGQARERDAAASAAGHTDAAATGHRDAGHANAGDAGSLGGDDNGPPSDDDAGEPGGGNNSSSGAPTIPEPAMTCPSLKSGTQSIMGLDALIVAGAPGATKGPLLIYWHGTGSSADKEVNFLLPAAVRNEITAAGGMVVARNSDSMTTRAGTDITGGKVWFVPTDYEFADFIAACAVKNNNIDPKKIYTTGCSAGGLMAGRMSLESGKYLAASSGNSGGAITAHVTTTKAPNPPVFLMYGTSSAELPGFNTLASNLASQIVSAGKIAIVCPHSGGHCQAPADLQQAAWQFMKDHPFGIAESPYVAKGLPASFPSYCKLMK